MMKYVLFFIAFILYDVKRRLWSLNEYSLVVFSALLNHFVDLNLQTQL